MPIQRNINQNFFKVVDSNTAYVLGFLSADGNLTKTKRGTHYFSLYSKDYVIVKKILDVMGATHSLSKRISETGEVYRFQIGSKIMYEDLVKLGYTPLKSKRMRLPKIPEQFLPDYIRGYFDGDGNVWIGHVNKKRRVPTKVMQVAFTSGSKNFLKDLLIVFHDLGLKGGAIYTSKTKHFSRLSLSTIDALKLAEIMYNNAPKLYLERKKLRFDQFRSK